MVPSLIARTLFSSGSLRRPKHPGRLRHSRREPRHKRHHPIPSIPGLLAPPLRLTVLAGFVGRKLLRGPQGRPMPPAHCILAAGQAPDHPVSWCSRSPRPIFPGSAISCAAPHAGSPSRTRLRRSQSSVPSQFADTSSSAVAGLNLAAAVSPPLPCLETGAVGTRVEGVRKQKQKQDGQLFKSALSKLSQGPRPHWVPSSPMVPLFSPGWPSQSRLLRPPSATYR